MGLGLSETGLGSQKVLRDELTLLILALSLDLLTTRKWRRAAPLFFKHALSGWSNILIFHITGPLSLFKSKHSNSSFSLISVMEKLSSSLIQVGSTTWIVAVTHCAAFYTSCALQLTVPSA